MANQENAILTPDDLESLAAELQKRRVGLVAVAKAMRAKGLSEIRVAGLRGTESGITTIAKFVKKCELAAGEF